jgi:leucyl aminopeptidase
MGPSMQITLDSRPAAKVEAEALVSYVFEPEKGQGTVVQGVIAELDRAAGGALGKLAASGEMTGKMLEFTLVHFAPGIGAQRIVLVGTGKREKFGTAELRRLASAAVRYLKARSVKRIAFLAREGERTPEAAQAVTEGLVLGNFDGDKYRTDKKNPPVESAALVGFDSAAQSGLERGRIIAESQNFTR